MRRKRSCKTGRYEVFIDPTGKKAVGTDYDRADSFHNGLALVQINRRWGFLQPNGELTLVPYDDVYSFREGMAAAAVRREERLYWGYIDTGGAWAIEALFEQAESFCEGRAAVCQNGKYGHIDQSGAFTTPPEYHAVGSFSQGYAVVMDKHAGYADRAGRESVPKSLFCVQGRWNCSTQHS